MLCWASCDGKLPHEVPGLTMSRKFIQFQLICENTLGAYVRIKIGCCKRISHDEILGARECQKSSLLLGDVDASVQLEGQETRTGFLLLQQQISRDWEEREMGPPFLTVPKCQMRSAGWFN